MNMISRKQGAVLAFIISWGLLIAINFDTEFAPFTHYVALPLLLVSNLALLIQAFKNNK